MINSFFCVSIHFLFLNRRNLGSQKLAPMTLLSILTLSPNFSFLMFYRLLVTGISKSVLICRNSRAKTKVLRAYMKSPLMFINPLAVVLESRAKHLHDLFFLSSGHQKQLHSRQ